MTTSEILTTVNVAFNEKVKKVLKKSYNRTIDVQFGIYEDGRLTINLKPSHGWRDWLINFMAFGKMHYGYRAEFQQYIIPPKIENLKCHAKVTIKATDNNNIEGERKNDKL